MQRTYVDMRIRIMIKINRLNKDKKIKIAYPNPVHIWTPSSQVEARMRAIRPFSRMIKEIQQEMRVCDSLFCQTVCLRRVIPPSLGYDFFSQRGLEKWDIPVDGCPTLHMNVHYSNVGHTCYDTKVSTLN